MIVVRVELHSAVTGKVTELGRMHITNTGEKTGDHADYSARTLRGRDTASLDKHVIQRQAMVKSYPRERYHVWTLVGLALKAMGYAK